MCFLHVAILTAVLLKVKTFVLYPRHHDQEVLPGEVQMCSMLWQQGLNFAFSNLTLLGSCTYSHSYGPEAPYARVKYVAHGAFCCNYNAIFLNSKRFQAWATVVLIMHYADRFHLKCL